MHANPPHGNGHTGTADPHPVARADCALPEEAEGAVMAQEVPAIPVERFVSLNASVLCHEQVEGPEHSCEDPCDLFRHDGHVPRDSVRDPGEIHQQHYEDQNVVGTPSFGPD